MIGADLIAVADHVPRAGSVVWWRLSGDVSCAELRDEWASRGLDERHLPSMPTPTAALSRAVGELRGAHTLVRPLARSEGRAVVVERPTATGDSLDYEVSLRTKVDAVGRPVFDPPDHPRVAEVLAAFHRALHRYDQHTIGGWLVKLVEQLDGVRLRDTGGVYFVPHYKAEAWRTYVAAIHASSAHRINAIPALRADDAVASVLDALEAEAAAVVAELEAELSGGELTPRKAENRVQKIEVLAKKVQRYEALLSTHAPRVTEQLEALHGVFSAATLIGKDFG